MPLHERGQEDLAEILPVKSNDFPPSWRGLTKTSSRSFTWRWETHGAHDRDCKRRYVLKIRAVHTKAAAAEIRTSRERLIDHVLMEIRKFRRPLEWFEISLSRIVSEQS